MLFLKQPPLFLSLLLLLAFCYLLLKKQLLLKLLLLLLLSLLSVYCNSILNQRLLYLYCWDLWYLVYFYILHLRLIWWCYSGGLLLNLSKVCKWINQCSHLSFFLLYTLVSFPLFLQVGVFKLYAFSLHLRYRRCIILLLYLHFRG